MIRWLVGLLIAIALVAGAVVGYRLWRERVAEAEARRSIEAELLTARGQVVVALSTREHLEQEVARLRASNTELDVALAKARKAAPGARPVAVASASTGPVVAGTDGPRPPETGEGLCSAYLLAPGDRVDLRVDEVLLETRERNRVLVGVLSAWRVEPGPETQIAVGPFSAPLTSAEAITAPGSSGWSTWVLVAAGVGGVLLGGLVVRVAR